jgi:hypothetical protein
LRSSDLRGEVDHAVRAVRRQRLAQAGAVIKATARVPGGSEPGRRTTADTSCPPGEQLRAQHNPDKAAGARNEDAHRASRLASGKRAQSGIPPTLRAESSKLAPGREIFPDWLTLGVPATILSDEPIPLRPALGMLSP